MLSPCNKKKKRKKKPKPQSKLLFHANNTIQTNINIIEKRLSIASYSKKYKNSLRVKLAKLKDKLKPKRKPITTEQKLKAIYKKIIYDRE